jgi:hypothetical protein
MIGNLALGIVEGRTRGRRSNMSSVPESVPEVIEVANATNSAESQLTIGPATTDDSLEEETPVAVVKKPTHSRVILEISQLEQAFACYPCPGCSEHLELKVRTVCIDSSLELI